MYIHEFVLPINTKYKQATAFYTLSVKNCKLSKVCMFVIILIIVMISYTKGWYQDFLSITFKSSSGPVLLFCEL